ncbi:DUF5013 domain-containing protein [Bacteroides sp.]|uniref:DUF5013 domain-containing protein n=1 Tax=Bacteroides sp. TaxID=29523 RepID=UPI0025C5B5C8|nr:DUF5013 domain-containing protein [Bacteroides sp.]
MKHLLKNIIGMFTATLLVSLFSACEQDPQIKKYEYPMPEVSGISPSVGFVASQVVIAGTNFGDRTEPVKIFFGGVQAKNVLMCKNDRIAVEVPEGAATGDVTMQIWTNDAGVIGQYQVLPTPAHVSTTSGNILGANIAAAGETITIKGKNFGDNKEDVSVSFNGTPAVSFSLVDSETITAEVPEGYASGSVILTIHGYELVCGAMMNPDAKGDVTIFYLKNYKYPFSVEDFVGNQAGSGNEMGWFATPTYWVVSDEVKCMVNKNAASADGRVGGTVKGYLGAQAGWGGSGSATSITNGKLYQALTLPGGEYDLAISYTEGNVGDQNVYAVLAKGNDIPEPAAVTTDGNVIKSYKLESYDSETVGAKTVTWNFTLNEPTKLAVGFAITVGNQKYFKVSEFKLTLK